MLKRLEKQNKQEDVDETSSAPVDALGVVIQFDQRRKPRADEQDN